MAIKKTSRTEQVADVRPFYDQLIAIYSAELAGKQTDTMALNRFTTTWSQSHCAAPASEAVRYIKMYRTNPITDAANPNGVTQSLARLKWAKENL